MVIHKRNSCCTFSGHCCLHTFVRISTSWFVCRDCFKLEFLLSTTKLSYIQKICIFSVQDVRNLRCCLFLKVKTKMNLCHPFVLVQYAVTFILISFPIGSWILNFYSILFLWVIFVGWLNFAGHFMLSLCSLKHLTVMIQSKLNFSLVSWTCELVRWN